MPLSAAPYPTAPVHVLGVTLVGLTPRRGDAAVQMPSLANAVAAGSTAAAAVVHGLMSAAHDLTPVGAGAGAPGPLGR